MNSESALIFVLMAVTIDCHAQNKPSQDSIAAQYLQGRV